MTFRTEKGAIKLVKQLRQPDETLAATKRRIWLWGVAACQQHMPVTRRTK